MMVVNYAGGEFMTSDAIADALMQYSAALAEGHDAATIDLPIVTEDGNAGRAVFLVGPASQIVARTVTTDLPEPDDAADLEHLKAATRSLRPSASVETEADGRDQVEWNWEN
ncbi:MAG: hypothetical protein WBX17_08295 [Microbacterium sp.]